MNKAQRHLLLIPSTFVLVEKIEVTIPQQITGFVVILLALSDIVVRNDSNIMTDTTTNPTQVFIGEMRLELRI